MPNDTPQVEAHSIIALKTVKLLVDKLLSDLNDTERAAFVIMLHTDARARLDQVLGCPK